ncbi:dihydrofolate reductase [Algivirga pacifica]|uniref:Dihydrofolate reductase n=1 Tax=Algivirga pacifica TaxID=1162670 RepID=A0ABP9DMJ5_9BACT
MKISIIVAYADQRVIGKDNDLIWHLPADLANFKKRTEGHYIIMGRKTHDSIGRQLPNRTNIVVTRNTAYEPADNCIKVGSLEEALTMGKENGQDEVFIIGGAELYTQSLDKADRLYITEIDAEFEGDTFFPAFDLKKWDEVSRFDFNKNNKNPYNYSFITYHKKSN